ncbi:hypothetical protein M413DRAFT_70883 [Hebeloma cylindrosporum]|uniref:Uncharacterized protein n=1 Tax=Hebeloma cylindrosporum TaxID=76867 RepID=A0A0C3CF77_HEBCY|nr:hypothetical protein M413DRAFT_70883 [Hebeloma cylindrosporum h7]
MNDSKPSTDTVSSFLPNLNLGNGLIEIAALTTLIGSSTAGDLVLGNRGAAGLVWGSISAFGASSVIKACASAASPGWLRHMLGLRTASSDKALGMDLSLSAGKKVERRMRDTLDNTGPIGVSCLSDDYHTYRDIYAFDSTTSITLSELLSTDSTLTVHTHYPYAFYSPHHFLFQITVLAVSLLKSLEIYSLFRMGGTPVAVLSAVPFLFSFFSAIGLEIHDILTSRRPLEIDGRLDLVAASPLPTTKRPGGPRKVVLGASPNPRKSNPWWKFFWIVTGILQTLFIVLAYVLLGQQKTELIFTWAGFQLFWLVARTLIFNLTENTHPMAGRPMKGSTLEALSPSFRLRVANLVLAVGQYQAHVHPRNWDVYFDDSFSTRQIARLLAPENIAEVYPLLPERTTIKVNILAVIGDTSLSSAAWMLGDSKYSPMDLYDSCIVVFEVTSSSFLSSTIPSARVFSARLFSIIAAQSSGGEDAIEPLFIPRGTGSQVHADEKTWIYWVPSPPSSSSSSSSNAKVYSVLGRQVAEVLDDNQLSRILGAGKLNISLTNAQEVREVVEVSRRASDGLRAFLR